MWMVKRAQLSSLQWITTIENKEWSKIIQKGNAHAFRDSIQNSAVVKTNQYNILFYFIEPPLCPGSADMLHT